MKITCLDYSHHPGIQLDSDTEIHQVGKHKYHCSCKGCFARIHPRLNKIIIIDNNNNNFDRYFKGMGSIVIYPHCIPTVSSLHTYPYHGKLSYGRRPLQALTPCYSYPTDPKKHSEAYKTTQQKLQNTILIQPLPLLRNPLQP